MTSSLAALTPGATVTITVSPSPSPSLAQTDGTTAVQVWTLIVAALAVLATGLSILFVRKTGRETAKAAQESAEAATRSSRAAERSAFSSETTAKREEVMRSLRWASELAISQDQGKARLGVSQLRALGESDFLDASQQPLVDAALAAVVATPVRVLEDVGGDAEVIGIVPAGTALPPTADVPSAGTPQPDEGAR